MESAHAGFFFPSRKNAGDSEKSEFLFLSLLCLFSLALGLTFLFSFKERSDRHLRVFFSVFLFFQPRPSFSPHLLPFTMADGAGPSNPAPPTDE